MHTLHIGNDAVPITTDEPEENMWEWNESDEVHGSTTAMIRSLENDDLEIVGSPGLKPPTEDQAKDVSHESRLRVDAAGEPIHTELHPILTEEQLKKLGEARNDDSVANRYGKKVDGNGGFNPYG
ncbi:MAG: hypothetical protein GY727_13220 [Gammaproteobacteria bacterium]|nr:hypothetical protein [Gammaproteobacteria bacterium]